MNQKWYRAGITKAVLVITAHVMVAVIAVSLMRLGVYPAVREEVCDGSPAEKYEDSSSFSRLMRTCSARAVGEISAGELFETKGEFDPDKLVDLEIYYNTGMLEDDSPGTGYQEDAGADAREKESDEGEGGGTGRRLLYRLGDLLAWYENRNAEQSAAEQIVVCKRTDDTFHYYEISDFYELIHSGELKFIAADDDTGLTEQNILEDMEYGYGMPEGVFRGIQDQEEKLLYSDCWLYDGKYELEEYRPVDASSIIEIANEEPKWNGKLNEIYTMLEVTLEGLGGMYESYGNYEDSLSEGDTNFSYIYVNMRNKHVYTNRKEFESYAGIRASLEKIKSMGKYIVVMPKLADFDTNMEVEAEEWRDVIKYTGPVQDDFLFAAAADTSYPVEDEFYRADSLYEKYIGGVRGTAVRSVAAAVIFLICVLWLASVAGRSSRDEELHLNGFDRWKTEPAAAALILPWGISMAFGGSLAGFTLPESVDTMISRGGDLLTVRYPDGGESLPGIVWIVFLAVWSCTLFLTGFLSLVRRIKAKTLWENSLTREGCRFIGLLFRNLNMIWRTVLLFGLFLVMQLFIYLQADAGMSRWTSAAILTADAAAFVWVCHTAVGKYRIRKGIQRIAGGDVQYTIPLDGLYGEQRETAELLNRIGGGLDAALAENMKSERLKTDLITNVSHDIKTPLTSIINYVELLKQEKFEDPKLRRYIEVLEQKSQRLKTLTEDVVEASKVSSGNITLEYMDLDLAEMLYQTSGEFEEKFKARNLKEILTVTGDKAIIRADGRRTWRILENVYNNAAKYAMEGTRIYGDLTVKEKEVCFSLKNVSEQPLNISADELTERFIRGDISRSTEGSGLGLSIAKTLTQMQGGKFELYLDGDLFKVIISFPRVGRK